MRPDRPLVVAALLGLLGLPAVRADEPDPPPKDPPKEEAPRADGEGTPPQDQPPTTDAPATPKAAWEQASLRAKGLGRLGKDALRKSAEEFLRGWEASGRTAEGEDRIWVARLHAAAERWADAIGLLRAALKDGPADAVSQDEIRLLLGETALSAVRGKALGGEERAALLKEAEEALAVLEQDASRARRGGLRFALGSLHGQEGRDDDAVRCWMLAAHDQPGLVQNAGRMILGKLTASTHDLEAYPAVRLAGRAILASLEGLADAHLAASRRGGNAQARATAEAVRASLRDAAVPLDLLGTPVPPWTVVRSFRGGESPKSYEGKVLLIDFWATWCPWCIRSFPAIRDLLKEYGDRGFAVVGLTAPSTTVYEARYEFDDDLKAKLAEGPKPPGPLSWREPPAKTPEEEEAQAKEKAAYRAKELEAIEKFVANHEMTWDVAMIDENEPRRYGVRGWPHGVLVDKHGRIRNLHGGALLRDKPESLAGTKRIIEALLREP